jgi:hypothetical protein
MTTPKVYQDIEATAGFYGPMRYLSLLTTYQDLVSFPDALSQEFIPITAARTLNPQASKLFAIGIIPPSANVTGNLLDRSASIATQVNPSRSDNANVSDQVEGAINGTTDEKDGALTGGGGKNAALHRWARDYIIRALRAVLGREPTMAEIQYTQAVGWLEGNYGKAKPGGSDAINNWGGVHCPTGMPIGEGNCRRGKDKYSNGKVFRVGFLSYNDPYDGCLDMVKNINARGSYGVLGETGTVMATSLVMRRGSYYGSYCPKAVAQYGSTSQTGYLSLVAPYLSEATRACDQEAIELHAGKVYDLIVNEIGPANKDGEGIKLGDFESTDQWFQNSDHQCGPQQKQKDPVCKNKAQGGSGEVKGDTSTGPWQGEGSGDAQTAAEEASKTYDTPLNQTELGKKFQAAQRQQIAATQAALDAMRNTPPLRLLVNPRQFGVKGTKIVQDGNWSRNGPIIEHWGSEQDKISASGRVAGFYAIDVTNAATPGLTRQARNFSASWANLLSLYTFYKNNGGLYLEDSVARRSGEFKMDLSLVGSIYIYYDGILYIGSFDSFNISEEEGTPHTVEYSFEFTVRAAFLLDRPDSRYDVSYQYSKPDIDLPPPTVPVQNPGASPGASQQAADQRSHNIEEYFQGLRDSPDVGTPNIDEEDDSGIEEIIAIEARG